MINVQESLGRDRLHLPGLQNKHRRRQNPKLPRWSKYFRAYGGANDDCDDYIIYMDMMMITRMIIKMMMITRIRMMMTGDAAPPSNHPPQLWKERDAGGGLQGCQGGGNIFKVITLSEYVPCLSPNNNKHHHNWLFIRRPMIEMTIPSSLDSTLAPPGHHICLVFSQ